MKRHSKPYNVEKKTKVGAPNGGGIFRLQIDCQASRFGRGTLAFAVSVFAVSAFAVSAFAVSAGSNDCINKKFLHVFHFGKKILPEREKKSEICPFCLTAFFI